MIYLFIISLLNAIRIISELYICLLHNVLIAIANVKDRLATVVEYLFAFVIIGSCLPYAFH